MRPFRYFLVAVVGLMLLAPVALASGSSAGDQQYTDPLAGSNSSSNSGSTTPSSPGSAAPATAPASSPSASPTPPAASASSVSSSSTSTTATSSLPRTGFDAWVAAAFGVALLGAGLAVRRQVHRQE